MQVFLYNIDFYQIFDKIQYKYNTRLAHFYFCFFLNVKNVKKAHIHFKHKIVFLVI